MYVLFAGSEVGVGDVQLYADRPRKVAVEAGHHGTVP